MNRYHITIRHGPFEWSVDKRYRHFHELHKSLVQFVEIQTKRSLSNTEKYVAKIIIKRYIYPAPL